MADADERFRIRGDLGPMADIQTLAAVLNDLARVADFAVACQQVADRNDATAEILRRRPFESVGELEDLEHLWYRRHPGYYPFPMARDVVESSPDWNSLLREYGAGRAHGSVQVEQLRYRNPLELVILASGIVVVGVLRLVRDWPERKRLNRAAAADYENAVNSREAARQVILSQLAQDGYRLSPDQVSSLLDGSTVDAIRALGDSSLEMRAIDRAE